MKANEIISTRTGGFGGSDAAMFYKIGTKGIEALSNSDKKRIRVAKGIDPYIPIQPTLAMQQGHKFEDWYEEQPFAPIGAEREMYWNRGISRKFATFFHADFATDFEIWELKCVQDTNLDKVYGTYKYQLQWQMMVSNLESVWLVICDSSKSFEDGVKYPVRIEQDEEMEVILFNGVMALDAAWDTLDLTLSEEWEESDLLPFEQVAAIELQKKLYAIKAMEDEAAELKARLHDTMQANGVRSIKSEYYTITFIPEGETRTLDKSALKKAHPEINLADFDKVSKKKSYITVKLK